VLLEFFAQDMASALNRAGLRTAEAIAGRFDVLLVLQALFAAAPGAGTSVKSAVMRFRRPSKSKRTRLVLSQAERWNIEEALMEGSQKDLLKELQMKNNELAHEQRQIASGAERPPKEGASPGRRTRTAHMHMPHMREAANWLLPAS
jgi:hypothetical protein